MLWAAPAAAQTPCRLALLLALDVSSSVDAEEHELQKAGIAASLNDPDIRHAILNGGPGTVALAVWVCDTSMNCPCPVRSRCIKAAITA